jgi:hypothetical protein
VHDQYFAGSYALYWPERKKLQVFAMQNKKQVFGFFFFFVLIQSASSQPVAGCVDGICINASVESIPMTIPWKQVTNDQRRSFVDPRYADASNQADAKNNVERGAVYAVSIYPEAAKIARDVGDLMGRDVGVFDAKMLVLLKTLRVACRPFAWTGEYDSTSGFVTEVTLMLYPSEGGANDMRVHRITRVYPKIAMGEELQDLRQKIQELINMPLNDKTRNHMDRSPIAMLSRSSAKGSAMLDIQVTPPGMFDTKNFGKDATCKNRISAQ